MKQVEGAELISSGEKPISGDSGLVRNPAVLASIREEAILLPTFKDGISVPESFMMSRCSTLVSEFKVTSWAFALGSSIAACESPVSPSGDQLRSSR